MTFRLVDVGYSLSEGQVVKLIFFAPWASHEKFFFLRKVFHIISLLIIFFRENNYYEHPNTCQLRRQYYLKIPLQPF